MNWLKNLKVSAKLAVGFTFVIFLATIVGIIGATGVGTVGTMFEEQTQLFRDLAKVSETLQRTRVSVREMVIGVVTKETKRIENSYSEIMNYVSALEKSMNAVSSAVDDPEIKRYFESGRRTYENELVPVILKIHAESLVSNMESILKLLEDCRNLNESIISDFDKAIEKKSEVIQAANREAKALANYTLTVIIIALIIAVIFAVLMAFYLTQNISRPIATVSAFFNRASTTGDINISPEDERNIISFSTVKDEIGNLIKNSRDFLGHITDVSKSLDAIANGDLTHDFKLTSDKDTMGLALHHMFENLNKMFGKINASTAQIFASANQVASTAANIASSSEQMSSGAQSLAEGATEQAASIRKVSESITEISEKTKTNAEMTDQAAKLANAVINKAERGSRQMEEMITAVNEVTEASKSVRVIMKTINGIAEQTNLLALNAAIEAARAGEHGRGFAVVAEEVRKLAAQSEEAVKETSSIIHTSMEKAELGARVAGEMAASLKEIVAGISESNQLITKIAKASDEQSESISQINISINHVADIVQHNSALAEESAAASEESAAASEESSVASEEMRNQATILQKLISQFKLKDEAAIRVSYKSTK